MRFILPALLAVAIAVAGIDAASAEDDGLPPVDYPSLPAAVATRAELVPAGWTLEAEASGDLDGDKRADLALVLQSEKPDLDPTGEPLVGPRMLVVAFGARKGYQRITANHQLIPRATSSFVEDYFDAASGALTIKRGTLTISLHYFATAGGWGMWDKTYSFKWRKDDFVLSRFDHDYTHRAKGDTKRIIADYGTRSLRVITGNIRNDATKTKKLKLPGPSTVTLEQVGDGMEFSPMTDE
ncbi:hypothetical protein [Neorhizobium alkalisoli]|uniref:hypothetical protein n=1 Tax=Neorhizobium alkalisoli TaxID=528178 RepID=UPI000CF94458|nr:hypothetical protein [Neorhizobium alkalisoli]